MSGFFPRRSTLLVTAVAAASFGALGFASIGLGAVIVGETRRTDLGAKAAPGIDAMKAQYKRPATIPFPKENPYTPEKAALGKKLYFDTRLSVSMAQSCASCHSPGYGRLATLEEQALGPIQAAGEMNMPLEQLMERLNSIGEYKPLFAAAFPQEGMSSKTLAKAIATYERTVVSERAPFDSWIEGNEKAISEEAKRGFAVFNGKALCSSCHEGWNFTNDGFQDIGLPSKDVGRGEFMPGVVKMQHAFKTPGLREIARRSPFMHDGSLATLEAVVEHYDRGGVDRPSRSDLMKPLGLTTQEKSDLVAFMQTLTSNLSPTAVPVLPR